MGVCKKHHFLPQFYLSGFAMEGKESHVLQIEKTCDARHYPVAITDAAERANFHTIVDSQGNRDSHSVEQSLARVEAFQHALLQRILSAGQLRQEDKVYFARFVAMMDARVPANKEYIEHQYVVGCKAMQKVLLKGDRLEQSLLAHAGPKYAANPDYVQKAIAARIRDGIERDAYDFEIGNATLLSSMFDLAQDPRIIGIISRMGVTIFEAPSEAYFLTGDCAVTRFFPRAFEAGRFGAGLIDREIELTLPLSSRFLARLAWSTTRLDHEVASTEMVREFNRRIIVSAVKTVFAKKITDELSNTIRGNHENQAGARVSMLDHDTAKGSVMTRSETLPVFPESHYQ